MLLESAARICSHLMVMGYMVEMNRMGFRRFVAYVSINPV